MRFVAVCPQLSILNVLMACCMGGVAGCGGSDSTGTPVVIPEIPVASIVVTGAPTAPFLVGDSATLVATALSATGATLANRVITWSSSEPTIAAVSSAGRVVALRDGVAVITASNGGQSATARVDIAFGRVVGLTGGAIRNADSSFFLNMPGNIFLQPTLIVGRVLNDSFGDARVVPGTVFSLGPDSVRFVAPASLKLRFTAAKVPRGLAIESMQLHVRTPAGWVPAFRTTLDQANRVVDASIGRGGIYAVRSMPVSRIVITGINSGSGIYSGGTGILSTQVFDSSANRLPDRAVAWSSSNPGIVSVDSLGRLVGSALGTATIKAAADGASATTTVTTVVSWPSDFTNAPEWVTYQGSFQHSTFVEASINPVRLHEIWTKKPIPGAELTQATIGGGRVFLATQNSDMEQRVVALNPTDGATLWSKVLPDVNTLNQPTYNSGFLYVTSNGINASYLHSLRETDGAQKYRTPFDGFEGISNAPVVVGNTVATPGGLQGGLYGFDLTTGAQRFFRAGSSIGTWTPAVYEGRLYTSDRGVQSINPDNGTLVSELSVPGLALTTLAVPRGPFVVGISNGQLFSINLFNSSVIYSASGYDGMPVLGSPIYGFAGDHVNVVSLSGTPKFTYALTSTCAPGPRSILITVNLLLISCVNTDGVTGETVAIDNVSQLPVSRYPVGGKMSLSKDGTLYIVNGDRVTAMSAF